MISIFEEAENRTLVVCDVSSIFERACDSWALAKLRRQSVELVYQHLDVHGTQLNPILSILDCIFNVIQQVVLVLNQAAVM